MRDAVDLYLSLRVQPPVIVVDTPCTMTTHLHHRVPDKCERWFQNRMGGFEKPEKGVLPRKVDLPELSNLELIKISDSDFLHPRTGSENKYILGTLKQWCRKWETKEWHYQSLNSNIKHQGKYQFQYPS